ncbi:uncharacterized protein LOC131631950 [Vicia villosa]|uniref:uncharacterized protein LOC131631950 n=1 Tax=Vicia villosa TaxID=3911 RepID=UPI00273BEF56|nr:uncharacterized protein LOC131631950 [Vicia villosa]
MEQQTRFLFLRFSPNVNSNSVSLPHSRLNNDNTTALSFSRFSLKLMAFPSRFLSLSEQQERWRPLKKLEESRYASSQIPFFVLFNDNSVTSLSFCFNFACVNKQQQLTLSVSHGEGLSLSVNDFRPWEENQRKNPGNQV